MALSVNFYTFLKLSLYNLSKWKVLSIYYSMEISFSLLRSKEIVNLYDGKRLGRAVDIVFDKESAMVKGVVVPGEKKMFRKADDLFVPISLIKKIGEDVILVKLSPDEPEQVKQQKDNQVYAMYKKLPNKE